MLFRAKHYFTRQCMPKILNCVPFYNALLTQYFRLIAILLYIVSPIFQTVCHFIMHC